LHHGREFERLIDHAYGRLFGVGRTHMSDYLNPNLFGHYSSVIKLRSTGAIGATGTEQ
jgi:hypothetical protein